MSEQTPKPGKKDESLVDQLARALDDDLEQDIRGGGRPVSVKGEQLAKNISLSKVERLAAKAQARETVHHPESEIEELKEETKKALPNYVVSIIAHLVLLALLSLVVLFQIDRGPPTAVYETTIVYEYIEEEIGEDVDMPTEEPHQDEAAPQNPDDVPEVERLHDEGEPAKVVSDSVTNRFGTAKEDALRRFGGTPGSERAVRQGLRWLSIHQSPNGLWDPYGYQRQCPSMNACPGAAAKSHGDLSVGVSGLVMVAYIGNGHTPTRGEFKETVARGLDALRKRQDSDGCVGGQAGKKYMYNHALGTLALVEMYSVTGDEELKVDAERALAFLYRTQQVRDGGWDYLAEQGRRSDTSVSGWCVLALKAAKSAGLDVPERVWKGAHDYMRGMTDPTGDVRYTTWPSEIDNEGELEQRGVAMMAVGLASRLFLGESRKGAMVQRMAERIRLEPPDPAIVTAREAYGHEMYYWYYATLAMFQMGGVHWAGWNDTTRDMVVKLQRLDGHAAGSFDPANSFGGREAGRVYSTAICVLILETYYRYLPIYATLKEELAEAESEDDETGNPESGSTGSTGNTGSTAGTATTRTPRPKADHEIDFAADPELAELAEALESKSMLKRIKACREVGLAASPNAAAPPPRHLSQGRQHQRPPQPPEIARSAGRCGFVRDLRRYPRGRCRGRGGARRDRPRRAPPADRQGGRERRGMADPPPNGHRRGVGLAGWIREIPAFAWTFCSRFAGI